jgi:hypothetical protein
MTVKSSFVMRSANSLDGSSFGLCLIDDSRARDAHLSDTSAAEYRSSLLRHMSTMLFVFGSLPPVGRSCVCVHTRACGKKVLVSEKNGEASERKK